MRRTRQLLQGALLQLLGSKSFDDISVQDIAEAATVNRATFYDHYTDKFALLESPQQLAAFTGCLAERSVQLRRYMPVGWGGIVAGSVRLSATICARFLKAG